jgi:hypothetical protein
MTKKTYEEESSICGKTILDYVKPSFCKLIDQSKAISLPDF